MKEAWHDGAAHLTGVRWGQRKRGRSRGPNIPFNGARRFRVFSSIVAWPVPLGPWQLAQDIVMGELGRGGLFSS
jgi:hypothetical protein